MDKTLIFFLVIQICLTAYSIELPDVKVLYNVHDDSDNDEHFLVDVEIHAMTDSLGKLFILKNQTILLPVSSRSLPLFECFPSSHSCKWRSNDSWRTSNINIQQLKAVSLPLENLKLPCEYNNGGCKFSCNNSPQGPQCSCPYRFSLSEDGRMCSSSVQCHHILRNDGGTISSPNYPNAYPVSADCNWYIITSQEKKIRLQISNMHTESGYDYVEVFEGKNTSTRMGKWSGNGVSVDVTSTGNEMLVHFHSDGSNQYRGFQAQYSTTLSGRTSHFKVQELMNEAGVITTSLNVSGVKHCISVIYLMSTSSSLDITAEQSTGSKVYFKKIDTSKVNEWLISRFVPEGSLDASSNLISISVHLTGKNSKIFNIVECSSEGEDVYILPPVRWTNNTLQKHAGPAIPSLGTPHKCEHGGTYNSAESKCICPPGFDGPLCQEACGSNHFGPNCTAECSWFEKGCRNMLFCNLRESCMCASGFKGADCGRECDPGYYGANCLNPCGECEEDGLCDAFTGKCNSQCREGYYPPLCQQQYIYLKVAPTLKEVSWNNVIVLVNLTSTDGVGSPHLYEVQYKEKANSDWIRTPVQEIIDARPLVAVNVTDLKVGTTYLLRAVIISEDGNSYQGSNIPTLEFETQCQVPDSRNYVMESREVTSSSFIISWKYPILNEKWCSVSGYQVTLQGKWRAYTEEVSFEETEMLKSNLLSGQQYTVHVCAITRKGSAPCSFPFTVTTTDKAPGNVRHLNVERRGADVILISWRRPLFTGGTLNGYRVHYECVRHLICEEACTNSSGSLTTMENFASLMNLLPHAQYKLRVAAVSASEGPYAAVFATTKATSPSASPVASDQPIVSKTNTSVTVQWQPPDCPGSNGHLTGYFYMLYSDTERGETMLQNGTTKLLNTTFTALSPMTEYRVHVHAMNSHGWNNKYKLIIVFSSSATVPEAVQDLQIYKKGRRMLGIRWAKPIRTYGTLESFTITHQQIGKEQKVVETVPPTSCLGWPHLYCHTINLNIRPDRQYVVTVAAQNSEIDQDGTTSEIIATTRENAPDAPSSLSILRSTSTSFELQWGLPNMFNGELRSFLVNIEHMEAFNESDCCEYFPVQELPFREESPFYNLEVTGLIPASTYVVSVSAKTITMGPSINTTYYTAPLPPADLRSPRIMGVAGDGYSYVVTIQPSTSHLGPDSLYLLLVLPPNDLSPPAIWKTELLEKLTRAVNQSFYIVSEYTDEEFTNEIEMEIGTGTELRNGTVGSLKDPKFTSGFYQLGLALVQRYRDAVSVGLSVSNRFKVGELSNH